MLVWHKIRKDGGSDGRGVGFYFRNVTELVLFGVRGGLRTGPRGRTQVNYLATRRREHSRKPDELYPIVEGCSPGPTWSYSPAIPATDGLPGATKLPPTSLPEPAQPVPSAAYEVMVAIYGLRPSMSTFSPMEKTNSIWFTQLACVGV